MKLLLGGTDPKIADMIALAFGLRWPDTKTMVATDGVRTMELIAEQHPDVIILDPNFADMSMVTALQQARQLSDVPLLVVAREGDELEAVKALELGADDYIRAPNNYVELVARVVALMRRINGIDSGSQAPIVAGRLLVNAATYEVFLDDQRLALTSTEFRLLHLLMSHRGSVVTYGLAEQVLWAGNANASELVKKYIMRLRRKLGDDSQRPTWILNVHGIGYRFIGASRADAEVERARMLEETRSAV